jgi:HSP20 family protein
MFVRRIWPSENFERSLDEFDRLRREMDHLFHALEGDVTRETTSGVFPLMNITQDEEHFYVRAEIPGVNADDLKISTTKNRLSLSGRREIQPESERASYHRREREGGAFNRTVTLPSEFDSERVQASYVDGILTVTLPRAPEQKPRQIPVKTN